MRNIKEQLFQNAKKYGVNENILNKIFDKVFQYNNDEESISKEFTLEFEKYLVEQINNGNIDLQMKIIEANSFLKVLFQRNPKYAVKEKNINKLYEDAVELSIESYNGSDSLSMIILKNMKKLSLDYSNNVKKEKTDEKAKTTQVHEEVIPEKIEIKSENTDINLVELNEYEEKEDSILDNKTILTDENDKVDLSFLNLLIKNGIMSRRKLAEELKINLNLLDKVLSGEQKLKENHLISLYKKYNVNDACSLKEKIKIECEDNNIQKKESLINSPLKIARKTEKLYNLSFFKEYVSLFKLDKLEFAKLIKCEYVKIEEVLAGKTLVKESIMLGLYLEFNVCSYKELKKSIETKVQLKKIRDKYKNYISTKNENYKRFNIDILNEYFKYSGLDEKAKMAESLGMSTQNFNSYLRKKTINSKNMKKIFVYFNVENYNQFIEVIFEKMAKFERESDLFFLSEYYSLSKEDYEPLAKKLGLSSSTLENYIKTNSPMLKRYLESICKYFQVQDYDELEISIEKKIKEIKSKEENIFDIDENKLIYDHYQKLNEYEREELANIMEIEPVTLRCYISSCKTKSFPKRLLKKVVEYYNVDKLSELKEIFDERENEQKDNKEKIFDINGNKLVHDYYKTSSEEERKELANIMGIALTTLKNYMADYRTKLLPKKLLIQLLEYYNVDKLSELKEIFENKRNEQKNIKEEIFDIDANEIFYDYYRGLNEEEKKELANALKITPLTLKTYMSNRKTKPLSEDLFKKLLEYYDVEKLSELKEIFEKKINRQKNDDIKEEKETSIISEEYNNIASKIDKNLMFSIMNVNTLNREDYIIVMLLFGGFRGRYYSVESISNFLGIEKEYVLEIYNKCLSEYKRSIIRIVNNKDNETILRLETIDEILR